MPGLLKHMDIGSRNARLCETLQGLGLYVVPVYAIDDPERIDYMQVSVALPSAGAEQGTQNAAREGVAAPVASPEVRQAVAPSKREGENVVYLPTVLGVPSVI
jgi:hypothetical protein